MTFLADYPIGLLGAPWQVVVVAVVALGLFAPQLLPKVGRLFGRLLRAEAFRRIGIAPPRRDRRPAARPAHATISEAASEPVVEVLTPEAPMTTLRASSSHSIAPRIERRHTPIWIVTVLVFAAAGAIFWLLLHTR